MAFDKLPAALLDTASAERGDLLARGTAGYGRLGVGAAGQVLMGGSDPAWAWRGWVQRSLGSNNSRLQLSARIPGDDTKPQQSEGTEIVTVSITPKLPDSLLRLTAWLPLVQNPVNSAVTAIGSFYRDAAVDPIASGACAFNGAENVPFALMAEVTAGSTSPSVFKLRYGPVENYTLWLNGNATSRMFGGALSATLIVDEFAP